MHWENHKIRNGNINRETYLSLGSEKKQYVIRPIIVAGNEDSSPFSEAKYCL